MTEADRTTTDEEASEELEDLELKTIGDFEEEKEVKAMETIATKSHGHAIRDA